MTWELTAEYEEWFERIYDILVQDWIEDKGNDTTLAQYIGWNCSSFFITANDERKFRIYCQQNKGTDNLPKLII